MAAEHLDLPHRDKMRILREVILEIEAPGQESDAERHWRQRCEHDVARDRARGYTSEIPFDAEAID